LKNEEITVARDIYHALFIDDDREFLSSMRLSVAGKLNGFGNGVELETHFLNGPHEALALTSDLREDDEEIAVIVSDQQMPDITGIELMERVKGLAPNAIKVLLTGYASLDSAKYAINNQILDQYVSKPIEDYDNFRVLIRNAVQTACLRAEKEQAEQEIRRYVKQLEETNKTIKSMHLAAERIAYFAQGFKKLDLEEVMHLIMTKIPEVFRAQYASLFLVDEEKDQLQVVKSNHFRERYTRPLKREENTPMMAALRENKVIVLRRIDEASYELIGKEYLGSSCIIIPFVITSENASVDLFGNTEGVRGVLNLGNVADMEDMEVVQYAATLVQNILGINILNAQLYQRTHDLALHDGLTGLYNKHVFMEFLTKECAISDRSGVPVQLGIFDLDDFKAINDTHGHLAGDAVLSELGKMLRAASRKGDVVGRFGGEEFAWLSSPANGALTIDAMERVRKTLERKEFPSALRVRTSVGVAHYQPNSGDSPECLIERADQALYRAKSLGKNRIELASDHEPE
jgi:diguanylate cyclase (GGDEF)-like protein